MSVNGGCLSKSRLSAVPLHEESVNKDIGVFMINIPKGTKDVLPSETYKWHFVEKFK